MNIGIRLHDTAGTTLEERVRYAKQQGFSCFHLAMQKATPNFEMLEAPTLMTDKLADEVRSVCEKYEMEVAVLGCYLQIATPDPEKWAKNKACYEAHLRFARKIGARCVGTESDRPNMENVFTPAAHTEEALATIISRVGELSRYAEDAGSILAIEPVYTHIVHTPQRARIMLDEVNSPALKIILDTVNLLWSGNCANQDQVIADSLSLFGDKVTVLHMKDYVLGKDDIETVPSGHGLLNATELLRFAREHQVPMTLENTTPDNAEAARLFLEQLAARL